MASAEKQGEGCVVVHSHVGESSALKSQKAVESSGVGKEIIEGKTGTGCKSAGLTS